MAVGGRFIFFAFVPISFFVFLFALAAAAVTVSVPVVFVGGRRMSTLAIFCPFLKSYYAVL